MWSSFLTNNYNVDDTTDNIANQKIVVLRLKPLHISIQQTLAVDVEPGNDLFKIVLCYSWYSFRAERDTARQISWYPLHIISIRTLYVGFDCAIDTLTFRKHFAISKLGIVVLQWGPQNHHLTQRKAIETTSAFSDSKRPYEVSPISLGFIACVYNWIRMIVISIDTATFH